MWAAEIASVGCSPTIPLFNHIPCHAPHVTLACHTCMSHLHVTPACHTCHVTVTCCPQAPVSGSKKPAIDGQLVILAAGDESLFNDTLPAFSKMGKKSFYLGPTGAGVSGDGWRGTGKGNQGLVDA